jgi:hypothetical protein
MPLVITNNPKVENYIIEQNLGCRYQIARIEGYVEDVLSEVRALCHKNHKLLTHPLTGSIKPNYTPYKTVVLDTLSSQVIDFTSVMLAESCLDKTMAMLADRPRPCCTAGFAEDFAVIDLDLFKSFLISAHELLLP